MFVQAIRKSSRCALRRCVALLAALVVLTTWSVAWAMPVGMCDEHAQSMAAPFPLLPSNNGEARAGSGCEGKRSYELGRVPVPDHEPSSVAPPAIERVPPLGTFALPRTRGQQLPPVEAVRLARRPGHQLGVFRPPRA